MSRWASVNIPVPAAYSIEDAPDNRRRGKAIFANSGALRQEILDRKILGAIAEVLKPEVLERSVEKALAKLSYARSNHASRRTQVERELEDVQRSSTG